VPLSAFLRRFAAGCTLLAAGCAISQPEVPLRAFVAGDLARVEAFATTELTEGYAENEALVRNVLAQCELLRSDVATAHRDFVTAGRIMGSWAVGSGEATGAILGSESSKFWRGDPYEQAMNAFYIAYCYQQLGEPDNARAACKRGILADAEVADERYQADNALLFWLAGRLSLLMGSPDAPDFFREAEIAHAFALQHGARGEPRPSVITQPARGNVVLLFECGMGPEKYGDGAQEELARFRPRWHPALRARATLGGRSLGASAILCDVDYQARTLGGTEMEGIRKGKAVFKTASAVAGVLLLNQAARDHGDSARTQAIAGGVLLLASLLTSSSADVRHWPTLPSTVQVLTAEVPPGTHRLDVEFLDARGRPLPELTQSCDLVVPATGEAWQLFRSLPLARGAAAVAR
jgi:hypothetical protein